MRKIDLFIHQLSSLVWIQVIFGKPILFLNVEFKQNPPKHDLLSAKCSGVPQTMKKHLPTDAVVRQRHSHSTS